jgi:hypothetical protein
MRTTKSLAPSACLFLALLAGPRAQAQSAYFQAVTNLNPVAYWPLQETAAPPAADVETNLGSLGASANAYFSCVDGAQSQAYGVLKGQPSAITSEQGTDFSAGFSTANGSFMAVPLTDPRVSVSVQQFTVEAWVYPALAASGGIVSQNGGPYGSAGLNMGTNAAGYSLTQNYIPSINSAPSNCWCFHVFNGVGPAGGAEAVAGVNYNVNTKYYHIVAVFDGTNASIYVNGVDASAATGHKTPMTGSYMPSTWDPLFIGANRGFNANKYAGGIDEVAIYTNALTAMQIADHYNAGTHASPATPYEQVVANGNPLMYWRMNSPAYTPPDQSTFPTATNYGSIGTDLANVPNGMAVYGPGTIPGVAGPALPGFGVNSHAVAINGIGGNWDGGTGASKAVVDCGYNPLFNPTGSGFNYSVVAWVKLNPADGNRWQDVVGHGDSSFRLHCNANASYVAAFCHGVSGDVNLPNRVLNVNDGNWHMLVGTYDTAKTERIVVDGQLVVSQTNTVSVTGSALNVLIGCDPGNIMSGQGNAYNQRFLAGSVAHVAIFTNALTLAQIQSLYSSAGEPPVIATQPPSGTNTVNGGTTQTIAVGVTGSDPLVYFWYKVTSGVTNPVTVDGTHILSTANLLVISNTVAADNGNYFVVVTNTYGTATSALSGLNVVQTPVILAQSPAVNFTLSTLQTLSASVTAMGYVPLTYVWLTNGVVAQSGTNSSYALGAVTTDMDGRTFQCIVSNAYGAATNTAVSLTVLQLNSSFGLALMALDPDGYWPMHETVAPVRGDNETNYGTIGSLANGTYGDWWYIDQAGSNANFSVVHQTTGALAGTTNPAVTFTRATGSFMTVSHTSPQATIRAPFSVETWVNPFDLTKGIILGVGGGNKEADGSADGIIQGNPNLGGFDLLWSDVSPGAFSLAVRNGNANGSTEPTTLSTYATNQWYHIVATFDGTNVAFYINGALASLNSSAASMNPDSWSPLCIGGGRWNDNKGTSALQISYSFLGSVDEMAVYTNVLSAGRIAAHYAAGTGPSPSPTYSASVGTDNPTIYLRMDSPPYVTPDPSTWPVMTNYGRIVGNGVYRPGSAPANVSDLAPLLGGNSALRGDGNSVYAETQIGVDLAQYQEHTVCAWVKLNPADVAQRQDQMLIGGENNEPQLYMEGNGTYKYYCGRDTAIAPSPLNDNKWHFLMGTCQKGGSGKTINQRLYIDGVQVIQKTYDRYNNPGFSLLYIAGYPNNMPGNSRQLAGSICEVAFWVGSEKSATQVRNLYNTAGVPPVITTQPALTSIVNEGANLTLTAAAAIGTTNLYFQWYKNNAPMANQTNTTLAFVPSQGSDTSTNYYVVVTNNYGAVTGQVCSVTVYTLPAFAIQPISTTLTNKISLYAGAQPTFRVLASGAQPIVYRWRTNGVSISGATNDSFTLPPVQAGMTNFSCQASNSVGLATSTVVAITITATPTQTYPQAVLAAAPINYWRLSEGPDNGTGNSGVLAQDYLGGVNGVYTNTMLAQEPYNNGLSDPADFSAVFGSYSPSNSFVGQFAGGVLGTSIGFNFTSNFVYGVDFATPNGQSRAFSVEAWAKGYQQTTSAGIVEKGYYGAQQFSLGCGNTGNVGYRFGIRTAGGVEISCGGLNNQAKLDGQWHHVVGICDQPNGKIYLYIDGVLIDTDYPPINSGILASTVPMTIGAVRSSTNPNYTYQFDGNVDEVAIYNYALTTNQILNHYLSGGFPPQITQQPPSSTNVNENGTLVVPTAAIGLGPLSYQWANLSTGLPIPNATNATLVITNYPLALNYTSYQLTVTNIYGLVQSDPMYVSVNPLPVMSLAPLGGGGWEVTYTGTLYSSTNVVGPYTQVPGASSPYTIPIILTEPQRYYRSGNP